MESNSPSHITSPESMIAALNELVNTGNGNPIVNEVSRADEILQNSEHKYWLDFPEPIPFIQIEINGSVTPFGTPGDFSLIKGPPKSRKTFFVSMLLAAALKNGCIQDVIRCNLPDEKRKIVVFDTEQSASHVNKVIRRAFRIAEIKEEDIKSYSEILVVHMLRPYDAKERVLAIQRFIEKTKGVGLVIIDGVRDLAYDINNIEQSALAVQNLLQWTHEKQLHLITVIHVNKGDKNATGHLGGELTKKAETVVEISRNKIKKNTSTIEATECRGVEFDKFSIEINETGFPIIVGLSEEGSPGVHKSKYPSDISEQVHKEALAIVFKREAKLIASKFQPGIKIAFAELGIKFGDNAARDFVTYYKQQGLVDFLDKQAGNKTYYFLPDSNDS